MADRDRHPDALVNAGRAARASARRLASGAAALLAHIALRRCASVGHDPVVRGRIWVRGAGRVVIGDRVRLEGAAAPIELHAARGAQIVIGDDVSIGGGTSIEAQASITIGPGAHLDGFCKVLDNHFHSLVGDRTLRPVSLPVVIGARSRLGRRSIVLPGATIPDDTVAPPGSVLRGLPLSARTRKSS